MGAQADLLEKIRNSPSPLLGPQPLAHSQELGEGLPSVRRHVGPRPWYQCLEGPPHAIKKDHP